MTERSPWALALWWMMGLLLLQGQVDAEDGSAQRRTLIAAVPEQFAPTCFLRDGVMVGFAIDILDHLANEAGCEITYVTGKRWDELQAMLRDGRADLIPCLNITPEREKQFRFTRALETVAIGGVVRSEQAGITELRPGLRIGVTPGSSAEEILRPRTGLDLVRCSNQHQLLLELLAGRLDAVVTSRSNLSKLASDAGLEDRLRFLQPPLLETCRAIAFRPSDAALCQRFDAALMALSSSPEFDAIRHRWYGQPASWWTPMRVVVLLGALLAAAMAGMLVWRILDLRATNRTLRTSEALLVQSQQVANLGHYVLEIEAKRWTSSSALDRIFGIGIGYERTLSGWAAIVHPDDRAAMTAYVVDEVFGKAVPFDREYRIVRQDNGETRWVRGQGQLELVRCQVVRMFGVIQDITERRQVEEAARAAGQRFETLFQGTRDAIFVADPQTGVIVEVNHQAELLIGRTRAEILGLHQSVLHPEDLREVLSVAFRTHADGTSAFVETEVLHRDGSRIPVEINSSLIPTAGGGRLLLGTFRDVRDRVRLQDQLRQSDKMTAIGQLAGGIAHDFNNQLAGISGYAEMLSARLQDPRHKSWAINILSASQRAADLTRQLLAFARKGQSLRAQVNLHQIVDEVVAMLGRSIDRRIHIDRQLAAKTALALGDPNQLHHALLNLAINARDAMPAGGRLSFTSRNVTLAANLHGFSNAAGPYIEIAVQDTGCGMDAEVRKHLFEPFFTTKEPGKGTGLGLAAAYGVMRNHGGVITVASEPGIGSTFAICLPQQVGGGTEKVSSSTRAALIQVEHQQRRILVVDDEDLIRLLTRELLSEAGYQVEVCASGIEAVERCQQGPLPDLVLLDLVMPVQGGRETFHALRQRWPGLRVLIASGHSVNGEAQELLDHGACGFLQKPYRLTELTRAVGEALGDGTEGAMPT